jgi:hypothetical protein
VCRTHISRKNSWHAREERFHTSPSPACPRTDRPLGSGRHPESARLSHPPRSASPSVLRSASILLVSMSHLVPSLGLLRRAPPSPTAPAAPSLRQPRCGTPPALPPPLSSTLHCFRRSGGVLHVLLLQACRSRMRRGRSGWGCHQSVPPRPLRHLRARSAPRLLTRAAPAELSLLQLRCGAPLAAPAQRSTSLFPRHRRRGILVGTLPAEHGSKRHFSDSCSTILLQRVRGAAVVAGC